MARALLRLGVVPGDRVGVLAPKSAAAVIGIYAALKVGARVSIDYVEEKKMMMAQAVKLGTAPVAKK